ncbi:MAG TPA: AI-2E family transporter [Gammaproteobacteria bacterium]|nr:AI-2E family transporter [Gammaproteobacteria bacterium]
MSGFQKVLLMVGVVLLGIVVYFLSPILTPFLLGALLAYLGNPLVNRLAKWHMPRTLAVTTVFIFITAVVALLLIALIPLLEEQIILLINKIPTFVSWIQATVIPWLQTRFGFEIPSIDLNSIASTITADWQQTGHVAGGVVKTIAHSSLAVFAVLLNLVLIPVVTFYLLRDWLILIKNSKDLIPRKYVKPMTEVFSQCNEVLGAFFRGQLLVMLALGIFYSLTLKLAGLELALLIGVLIAILSIVPYLGSIIGLAIAIIATLFQFPDVTHIIYILIIFAVGHVLEGLILAPLLIGDRIGLHPVAVIFAILAGGELFGFFGILLALPVAAVIMVWVRYSLHHYVNSRFYQK